jgi:hypothetical protein
MAPLLKEDMLKITPFFKSVISGFGVPTSIQVAEWGHLRILHTQPRRDHRAGTVARTHPLG